MYHPTLQQMRLFAAVARHRSITRAAEEVHLTQPSVSMQVKRLEEKIGQKLTEQIGKQLHLTAAGEEVFAACTDILARLEQMQTSLTDLKGGISGPLNVCVVSTAKYFLPHLLGSFTRRFPAVEPRLQITNRETLLKRLSNNEDDLYVTGQVPQEYAVESHRFLENVIVVVAHPANPLAREKSIPLTRLADQDFIRREPGSGTRKAVQRLFDEHGVTISHHMELDDNEAIKQGVISGLGVAFLSLHSLRLELAAGELVTLDVEHFPLRRRWYAVHRTGKHLSNAARAFLDYLLDEGEAEIAHLLHLDGDPLLK
ncbi:LysR family transcriptional regulator [Marimonas arenosa]|uniref:HTH-type transcriptional regulator CbbR n=1 Tax=Marimonas arenosa TaxID=1795305 RepID=A0AAE3WD02_9RHOB|nr:LysR family transcriptional regulator [Marimonas arenosa]MDQ2090233.1 LysR family transcriptional regulator [Marimonas arenosa]